MKCPQCGDNAAGKFCSNCGASLSKTSCAKCGAALSGGAKFCHACGAAAGAAGAPLASPGGIPWVLVGAVVVVAIVVLAVTQLAPGGSPPPAAAAPSTAGPLDLSQISPKDAADRLFNRVMQANESGRRDTAVFFAPMALQAYGMLDTRDLDARFHMGLVELVADNPAGAEAQADTIAQEAPTHLFAAMLRADAARARGDTAAARAAEALFLRNFDAELALQRTEYGHHGTWLSTYRNNIRQ